MASCRTSEEMDYCGQSKSLQQQENNNFNNNNIICAINFNKIIKQ